MSIALVPLHATAAAASSATSPLSAPAVAAKPKFDVLATVQSENDAIRLNFQKYQEIYKKHLETSHTKIIEWAPELYSQSSCIVVIRPSPVVPVNILVTRCARMVLIDPDPKNLDVVCETIPVGHRHKVTRKVCDLNGDAWQKLQELCGQIEREKLILSDGIERLIGFFNNFQQQMLPTDGIDADYVISAMVVSQLGSLIEVALKKFLTSHYGFKFGCRISDIPGLAEDDKKRVATAFDKFSINLQTAHMQNLANLTNRFGKVYFQDTFQQIELVPLMQKNGQIGLAGITDGLPLIVSSTFATLWKNFKSEFSADWQWMTYPEENVFHTIQAYGMQRDSPDSPD